MSFPIDVSDEGTILLGNDISCDGFRREAKVRVQTHIHQDHMRGFDSSKAYQNILVSRATKDLLALNSPDIAFRHNVKALDLREEFLAGQSRISLYPNEHMLGAVQALVETDNGERLGYSGDFNWPSENIVKVDALVLDACYGNPNSVRQYDQGYCEERFLELVREKLLSGPVCVIGNRGTAQRALQVLSGGEFGSLVCSRKMLAEVKVYRKYGYTIDSLLTAESSEGKAALADGNYIRFFGAGDKKPTNFSFGTSIRLSAYMTRPEDPILKFSERAFNIALSDHADFNGTIEYVRETGAKCVLTDNSRHGKALDLARELTGRLGIKARPSTGLRDPS